MVSPVEDETGKCGSDGHKVDCVPQAPTMFPAPVVEEEDDGMLELLPQEARANFDQIRSLVPDPDPDPDPCDNHKKKKLSTKNASLSRRATTPCPSIQLKRRKVHQIAASTVMLIDDEISRWMRGIAELEQLLAQTNSENQDDASTAPQATISESASCPCLSQRGGDAQLHQGQDQRLPFDDIHENHDRESTDGAAVVRKEA